MAIAEELQIIIDAKVTQAVKNLKNVQKGMGDTGKKANKMGDIFKKLAGPLALGAVVFGAIRLGKAFSDAASDAEEIGSKYATIFRDIRGDAEEVANTFAESFGLAGSTARELLGNTADLLTGLGFTQQGALELSEQVNTLAADLASFSNFAGGTTGASEALTKALLGEAESAKALGIVINQNTKEYKDAIKFYTEVEGKTLLQAKAFTALQFATEQSGNAIGDVARTFESHANVSRRLEESTKSLKEELGKSVNKGLTPMLNITDRLVKSMAEWLKKSNELNDAIEQFEKGTADGEQSVAALNNELINQVVQMKALQDAVNLNIAGAEGAVEAQKKRIEQTQILIGVAARSAALEAQAGKLAQDRAKLKAKDDAAAAKAAKEAAEDLKALENAFADTHEGQVKALETQIAFFETFQQGPMALAVLEDLREELKGLTEDTEELVIATTSLDIMFGTVRGSLELSNQLLENQGEIVEALTATWQDYATGVLGFLNAIGALQSANADAELQQLEESGASQEELDAKKRQIAHDEAVRKKKLGLLSVAIDTASAIVEALPNLVLAALAAATGAIQAAAINAVPIPAFATGTSGFIANKPQLIQVGEGAGSERVTVEPTGGSNGGNDMMTLNIDGEQFTGWVQRQLDNRNLRVPRSSLV